MAKLLTTANNVSALKALIAAKYSGKKVTSENVDPASANLKLSLGKVPALQVETTTLFQSSAIAAYLSNAQLRGGEDELKQAQVLQWLLYSDSEVSHASVTWSLVATGESNEKQQLEPSKKFVLDQLKKIDAYLLTRTFLVSESITLADIVLFIDLLPVYQNVLEPSLREPLVNVTRWFNTIAHQKQVSAVVGKVELCTTVKKHTAGAGAAKAPKAKAEPKPKAEPKAKAAKAEAGDDDGDVEFAQVEKPKDPFEALPKGTFNFDDFKRFYSNNPEDKSVPYFWEKFDKENYSIWICEYKYPQELTKVYMSCNLISGMFQRLDKMRKAAFASMILFGEDDNSTISGIWVWRGHDLAFKLSEDWQIDYESYDWKKLDANDDKTKTLVKEYFSWEGNFDGKKFNQGKIFK